MIAISRESSRTPVINNIVASLVRTLPKNPSKQSLIRAIFWWVKDHVQFREDEETATQELGYIDPYQEVLISPDVLVGMPKPLGDCDDFSMLVASLMVAAKIPVWFVAVAVDSEIPQKWSHVYTQVFDDETNTMIPVDCSHGKYLGWEVQNVYRRDAWYVG